MQKFERLLVHLDQSIMRGTIFSACVDMDYEEAVPVDDEEPERVS